jgi:hypothetical protein
MAIGVSRDSVDQVKREKGGRMYKIVTREYLASGHDGYDMLKGNKYLVEDEGGQMMSTIARKYLLGESITDTSIFPAIRLKRIIPYRVTVCEPNVTTGERRRSHPEFHTSQYGDDYPTREQTVAEVGKPEDALEACDLACDQVNQV